MKRISGGITRPKGYLASVSHCGIKKVKKDLCLIYSKVPAKAAGVFTTNVVTAWPIIVSRGNLKSGGAQAIIANSGNANCMTGREGLNDAEKIIASVAKALSIKKRDVLIASTGLIGKRLPVGKVINAVDQLLDSLGSSNSRDVARVLMTTDTIPKEATVSIKIGEKMAYIGGVAKGAGMIHPNMATMLAFITTDADITAAAFKKALKESVDLSFNCITVDGDTSTNDCVLALANGLAGNRTITPNGRDYEIFKKAMTAVCSDLAEKIVRDAEGATKFVRVYIMKARNLVDARKAAYAIATSPLVKTAIFGGDPNWGRIAAAVGRSGAKFSPSRLDIFLGKRKVLSRGSPREKDAKPLRAVFRKRDIEISVVLNAGNSKATILTCDLSKKYIDINARYLT